MPRAPRLSLDNYRHHYRVQLRWGDADRLGHINNTQFFRFAECSRTHYMENVVPGDIVPGFWTDCGLILAEIQCTFRRPVFHPGDLLLGTSFSLGNKSATVQTDMYLSDNRVDPVASSSGTVVWYDYKNNKTAVFPEPIREVITNFESGESILEGG